jgi:membrane-bound inhibitor of C-type lysozyme
MNIMPICDSVKGSLKFCRMQAKSLAKLPQALEVACETLAFACKNASETMAQASKFASEIVVYAFNDDSETLPHASKVASETVAYACDDPSETMPHAGKDC